MQKDQPSFTHPILDRAIYLLSKRSLFGETTGEKLGKKLEERFRYFLSAFITLALVNGATVPLSIADDQHASLQTFIKHGGPKHIINMMKSHLDRTELIRASLALLIVCVNLLRNKLSNALSAMEALRIRDADLATDTIPGSFPYARRENSRQPLELSRSNSVEGDKEYCDEDSLTGSATGAAASGAKESESPQQSSKLARSAALQAVAQRRVAAAAERRALQSVIESFTLALHAFSDSGKSAAMCVTLLVKSLVPSVQQLSLTLLALLVTVCGESARRMLQPPSTAHDGTDAKSAKRESSGERADTIGAAAVHRINAGKEVPASDGADRVSSAKPAKRVKTPLENSLQNAFASTSSFPLIAKRLGVYCPQNDRTLRKDSKGLKDGGKGEATASCLSYILTVAARENSSVSMAGCAEIVLAMTLEDEILASGASGVLDASVSSVRASYAYKTARTPTCSLRGVDDTQGSAAGSSGESSKKKAAAPAPAQSVPSLDDIGDRKGLHEEWAGVKILLRFLARNIRYFDKSDAVGLKNPEVSAHETTKNAVDERVSRKLERAGISSEQLQGLIYSFQKCISAVSSLIMASPKVTKEVASMQGAEELLRISVDGLADLVNADGTGSVSIADCEHLKTLAYDAVSILRNEKQRYMTHDHADHWKSAARRTSPEALDKSRGDSRPNTAEASNAGMENAAKNRSPGGTFGAALSNKVRNYSDGWNRPKTTGHESGRDREYAMYKTKAGVVLAGPGQVSVPKYWSGDEIKGPRSGGLSPVANVRPLSSQFGQSFRSDCAYSMPECPTRRGLSPKHQSRDDETCLHKVVFQRLSTPDMPRRLEHEDINKIADDLQHTDELRGRKVLHAVRKLERITKTAEKTLITEGFTYNGQHSVPQVERARRIYYPVGQPITWQMQESGDLGTNSTSYVKPSSSSKVARKNKTDMGDDSLSITEWQTDSIKDNVAAQNPANSPSLQSGLKEEASSTVSRLRDDGLKHKAFIESMIKVTQAVVSSTDAASADQVNEQTLKSMAVATASNAVNAGTAQVLSRPASANETVARPPIAMAIETASRVITAGTEKVLSRPNSAAVTETVLAPVDMHFGLRMDDFNFDMPNILEMTPIYSVGMDRWEGSHMEGLDPPAAAFRNNSDRNSSNRGEPVEMQEAGEHPEDDDERKAQDPEPNEEAEYQSVARTSRNVDGLVSAAHKMDVEQQRGYGRVKKASSLAFTEGLEHAGEHMELLFPKA